MPTAEQLATVQAFDGDVSTLGRAERFFLTVGAVPRYAARAKCMHFRAGFADRTADLKQKFEGVSEATRAVRQSGALKQTLEIVLALGNHLNGGTSRGGAWGFRLDMLSKLGATKTADGKSTLLHYVAKLLAVRDAATAGDSSSDDGAAVGLRIVDELRTLDTASRLTWRDECAELDALSATLKQCATQAQGASSDGFGSVMTAFAAQAESTLKQLATLRDETGEQAAQLVGWLGEEVPRDASTLQPEALFSTLHSFCSSLARAHTSNIERAEMEKKRARLAEAAAHQADIMSQISARRAKIASGKLKSTKSVKSTKSGRSRAASGISRQPSSPHTPKDADSPRPTRQPSSPRTKEGSATAAQPGGAAGAAARPRRKGASMLRGVGRTIIVMNDLKKWA